MNDRKKLIEVALPLEAINVASAREKSIRHGHPSTLHLWWARRPLAACRAVLFASLVDDPSSDPMFGGDEDIETNKRAELFNLIEELVQWDNSNNTRVLNRARAEIARCIASRKIETGELREDHTVASGATANDIKQMIASPTSVNEFLLKHAPPVLDPFCGGGSIPLEAQRLGLRALGSDLNPLPVLITKALVEFPARFIAVPPLNSEWQAKSAHAKAATVWPGATGLAEDVATYGEWMRHAAEQRIGRFYPTVTITNAMLRGRDDLTSYLGQDLTIIAWVWARTVASPDPACKGVHVPLVSSFRLCTKKGKEAWIYPEIERAKGTYRFRVRFGKATDGFDPSKGTVNRNGATCLITGNPIPFEYIREEGKANRMGVRLMAVVAEGKRERVYLPPSESDEKLASEAIPPTFPESDIPEQALGFRVQLYGLNKHAKLFTNRQLLALSTFTTLVAEAHKCVSQDAARAGLLPDDDRPLCEGGRGSVAYADAVATYLALAVSKSSDYWSNLCMWRSDPKNLGIGHVFARHALQMVWDFAEGNPFSKSSGSWANNVGWIANVLREQGHDGVGHVEQLDATQSLISQPDSPVISTDPPYYDNIGYADLSDFFYVWLRAAAGRYFPALFSTLLTPKSQELIATPHRHAGKREVAQHFFEDGLRRAFQVMRQHQCVEHPLTVYYAFKQAESDGQDGEAGGGVTASTGWETMLEGVTQAGFAITGTWPLRTELGNRIISMGTNALASSIVLVCRPKSTNAPLTTRREFISSLRKELPDALRDLQHGNVAPVDLAQASLGPGMAVFTRYSKVMETDGSGMTVRTALGLINQALDEVLAEQEGEFDADTRWALAWFEQFGMDEGPFGVAETLSKAKNTAVNGLVEAGVAKARGGKVQLLRRDELPDDWNPATDKRLTVWEVTQHLIRTVETKGESDAAALLHQLGGMGEIARDLAYRLYTICERNKWADEALAYNGLVIAWSELSKLALSERSKPGATQTKMFE